MVEGLQLARRKWFKTLKPVLPEEMIGVWRGSEIAPDDPLQGVLENLAWFGKRFKPTIAMGNGRLNRRSSVWPSR